VTEVSFQFVVSAIVVSVSAVRTLALTLANLASVPDLVVDKMVVAFQAFAISVLGLFQVLGPVVLDKMVLVLWAVQMEVLI